MVAMVAEPFFGDTPAGTVCVARLLFDIVRLGSKTLVSCSLTEFLREIIGSLLAQAFDRITFPNTADALRAASMRPIAGI